MIVQLAQPAQRAHPRMGGLAPSGQEGENLHSGGDAGSNPDHVRGDLDRADPQCGEDGVCEAPERGRLLGDVQIDGRGGQGPRDQPQPPNPHVEPGQHDVEGGDMRRAFHTLDIPLVFDNIAQRGARTGRSAGAQRVADAMSEALLAFARSGDPRTGATAAWTPYALPRRQTMVFGDAPSMQDDPRGGERALYAQVPFVQRGTF